MADGPELGVALARWYETITLAAYAEELLAYHEMPELLADILFFWRSPRRRGPMSIHCNSHPTPEPVD